MIEYKNKCAGTALVVQWLRVGLAMAGDADLIPGWGTSIPHSMEKLSLQ